MRFDHVIYALAVLSGAAAIASMAPARAAPTEARLGATIVACDLLNPEPPCDLVPRTGDLVAGAGAVVT